MENCSTTISFRCKKCGTKVKAPDEYAGRQGRCPRCKQPVAIPPVEEPTWLLRGIARRTSGNGQLLSSGPSPTRTSKSKGCEQASANAACALHLRVVDALEVSRLRREYKELQKKRQVYNRLSLAFAVPGFILLFFHYLPLFDWGALRTPDVLWLGSVIMLALGFGYHAKYRGRSFLLGPLLGCFGVVGLVVLKDTLKERMQQIGAAWSRVGESSCAKKLESRQAGMACASALARPGVT